MNYVSLSMALLGAMVLSICPMSLAHADSSLPTQSAEWAGIKNIMSVMGQGTLNTSDQKSLLDILDIKSAVEEGRPLPQTNSTLAPVAPASEGSKKLPPRYRPSAF